MKQRFEELKINLGPIKDQIMHTENYNSPESAHEFSDVLISWDIVYDAPVLLAVLEGSGEIIDISNK
jgi:hypothetical protein